MSSSNPERFQRLMTLFEGAVALRDADRHNFLERECSGDTDLRRDLESMLGHASREHTPLDEAGRGVQYLADQLDGDAAAGIGPPSPPSAFTLPATSEVAVLAGQYRILRVIGEGGMGTVYEAEQQRPRRMVALKAIRPGLASRQMLRRLEYEANVLGRLQHPGIAQVYEAGAADPSRPDQTFFAMELVLGKALTEYAEEKNLSDRGKLELVALVCDAIQHAHQRAIIHRDLKPSNILVTDDGQPKILDFGVALAGDANVTTMHTSAGQLVGTLSYMSPEQVLGDAADIDARSDVYSLGVILYRLLAGRLPHDLSKCSLAEGARIIRDDQPAPLGSLRRQCRGQIEMIVSRAMQKDRERRYQSAADLAADIRRHLAGEAIEARRDSTAVVIRRLYRQHRLAFVTAALALPLLAAFSVYAVVQGQYNKHLADEATSQRNRADGEAAELRRALYFSSVGFAQAALYANDVDRVRRLLDACPGDVRGWEWRYLDRLADRSERIIGKTYTGLAAGQLARDGKTVVVATNDARLAAVAVDTGTELWQIRLPWPAYCLAVSPDSSGVLVANSAGGVSMVRLSDGASLWETKVNARPGTLLEDIWLITCAFTPDGQRAVVSGRDGVLRVLDPADGAVLHQHTHRNAEVMSLAPGFAARQIVVGTEAGYVDLTDADTDASAFSWTVPRAALRLVACARAQVVYVVNVEGAAYSLTSASPAPVLIHDATHDGVTCISAPADGSYFVTGAFSRLVTKWSPRRTEPLIELRGDSDRQKFVDVTPDGKAFITGSLAGHIRLWKADTKLDVQRLGGASRQVVSTTFSRDGAMLACGSLRRGLRAWSTDDWSVIGDVDDGPNSVFGLCFSADGTELFAGDGDGSVYVFSTVTWEPRDVLKWHKEDVGVFSISVSPDGKLVASSDASGHVLVHATDDWHETLDFQAHDGICYSVGWSPDGTRLVTAGQDHLARAWSLEGKCLAEFKGHDQLVSSACYSPSGTRIATASEDGKVLIWAADFSYKARETNAFGAPAYTSPCFTCIGHRGAVLNVAFSPDGSRLVSAGADQTLRLWYAKTGEEILAMNGHRRLVQKAVFSPDGDRVASCSDDGAVMIWESQRGR